MPYKYFDLVKLVTPEHFTTQCRILTSLIGKKLFENTVGKGESTGNKHFLLSENVLYPFEEKLQHFSNIEIVCKCFQFGHNF